MARTVFERVIYNMMKSREASIIKCTGCLKQYILGLTNSAVGSFSNILYFQQRWTSDSWRDHNKTKILNLEFVQYIVTMTRRAPLWQTQLKLNLDRPGQAQYNYEVMVLVIVMAVPWLEYGVTPTAYDQTLWQLPLEQSHNYKRPGAK